MKDKTRHLTLFKQVTGKTKLEVPKVRGDISTVVGYWPSWAGNVRRR